MRSKSLWGLLGSAAVLCFAFIAFVAASSKPEPAVVAPLPKQPDFPVVKIITEGGGHGSGAILDGGYILTAGYVSEDAETVTVITRDGKKHEGEVLWSNHGYGSYDVSLIYVHSMRNMDGADLSCAEPVLGQDIVVLGNPKQSDWLKTWGKVANPDASKGPQDMWKEVVALDATATHGNSGGPVIDANTGVFVGLLVGGYPGTGFTFMVPGKTLCHMLGRV